MLCSRPTTDRASLAISLALIGLLTPVPPGDSRPSPRSRTVLPYRAIRKTPGAVGVEAAFASVVQARPCPTLADRFIFGVCPHRLRPGISPHALRIPPHDGHPALRAIASGGCRSALAVSGFSPSRRLGFLHTFQLSPPARHYPAFGYDAPHPSVRGTQPSRTTLLSAQYGANPWLAHRYFQPHGSATCAFSLSITNQVLKFRTRARMRVTPPSHRTPHSQ